MSALATHTCGSGKRLGEGIELTALRLAHLLAVGCLDEGSCEGEYLLLLYSPT
jgi:hypothetical protein